MFNINERKVMKLMYMYRKEYDNYVDNYFLGIIRGNFLSKRAFILKNYY